MIVVAPLKSRPRAELHVPGSKALTQRAMIAAALAKGDSILKNVSVCDDTVLFARVLSKLGFKTKFNKKAGMIDVRGNWPHRRVMSRRELDLGNCGAAMRFFSALCCSLPGKFVLDGSDRMRQRPIGKLVDALGSLGACVKCAPGGLPPVVVEGCREGLVGGRAVFSSAQSSQFVSALLLAAPTCRLRLVVDCGKDMPSLPYADLTVSVMRDFGVNVERIGDNYSVLPHQRYGRRIYSIEPDAASANYFFALAAASHGSLAVFGMKKKTFQPEAGFRQVLEDMGCRFMISGGFMVCYGPKKLKGIEVDMNSMPDSAPTLAAIAPFADSPTTIRNIAHLRHKESDRIASMAKELSKAGVKVEQRPDGMTIYPSKPQYADFNPHGDHRIAMSLSVMSCAGSGGSMADIECVSKSYPEFFLDLAGLWLKK